ncbi:MAG TPA: hypothetical protein VFQ22_00425 [Longimicrobiales bacterium]|nr:hypothetical protein [Longimicrobiales bacterium]
MRHEPSSLPALVLVSTLLLGACESATTLPDDLAVVNNLPDHFTYEVAGLDVVTDAVRYFWPVTGTPVAVDVTSNLSSGSVRLQLRDGNGDVVYSEDIADAVDDLDVTGLIGLWQIDLVFREASGSFSFQATRAP